MRHEEELKHLDRHKDRLLEKQAVREADAATKVAEEKARTEAKNKMLAAARQKRSKQELVGRKVESKEFSYKFLDHLQQQVFDTLERKGYFFDPANQQAENLMPWLGKQVEARLRKLQDAASAVDGATRDAAEEIEYYKEQSFKWREARDRREAEARRRAKEAEEERLRRTRVC